MAAPLTAEQERAGMLARQEGRHRHGPTAEQTTVSALAFLIARSDIDQLISEIERLRVVVEAARRRQDAEDDIDAARDDDALTAAREREAQAAEDVSDALDALNEKPS